MNITPEHKDKATEIAYATGKGLIASIPFVGGVAAELLGVAIPNKRMERVEQMLTHFSEKVKDMEESVLHQRMQENDIVELFEESVHEAAKTSAKIKLIGIANLLASGIKTDAKISELHLFLDSISRLSELDLLILFAAYRAFNSHAVTQKEFRIITNDFMSLEDNPINSYIVDTYTNSSVRNLMNESLLLVLSNQNRPVTPNSERYAISILGGSIVSYFLDGKESG